MRNPDCTNGLRENISLGSFLLPIRAIKWFPICRENEKLNTFFIVTNKTVQFQHLVCDGSHSHTPHDRNSRLALCSWSTGWQQKVDISILDLISEGKRALFASGTGAVSASDSPERACLFRTNMFERHVFVCHGCKEKHPIGMRTHNRKTRGERNGNAEAAVTNEPTA